MKIERIQWFALLLICLFTTACYSQYINLNIDKSYGYSRIDEGNCICLDPSGGFIIGGFSQSVQHAIQGDNDAWVIKLNSKGDSLWSRKYGSTGEEIFNSIHVLPSGNIMLLGSNSSLGRNHFKDAWVLIINSDGDSVDSKLFGGDYDDEIISSIQLTDGSFLSVGSFQGQFAYQTKIWLLKIALNGDTLWTKVYGSPVCRASNIIKLSDETFLLLGYKNIRSGYIGSKWVIKINSSGDTIWTRTFSESFINASRFSATILDNGLIALTGDSCNEDQDKNDCWNALIDQNGDVKKESLLRTCPAWDCFNSTISLPGRGYLSAGFTECGTPNEDNALLVAFNLNGDSTWSSTFGSSGIDEIIQLLYCNDSLIVFTGMKNNDLWIGSFGLPIYSKANSLIKYPTQYLLKQDANDRYSLLGRKLPLNKPTIASVIITKMGKHVKLK